MLIGIIVGVSLWFLTHNLLIALTLGYMSVGSLKYFSWRSNLRGVDLPPVIKNGGASGFIACTLGWPYLKFLNKLP